MIKITNNYMTRKIIITTSIIVGVLCVSTLAVFAQKTVVSNSAAIACVGTAVNAREQALGSAMSAYTQSINAAYAARAAALSQAYMPNNDAVTIRTAVRTAWANFITARNSARKTWTAARNQAWNQFKTVAKACKAPNSISDGNYSASETIVTQ